MRYRAVRRAERFIGLAVVAGLSSAAGAQEVQTAVFASTGVTVETNPYNEANPGGDSIALTADLRPSARWRSELTTIDLGAVASFRQFTRRYGLEDNYGLNGNVVTRVSDRVSIRSNADFSYNQSGFNNFARSGLLSNLPTNPTENPFIDPTLIDPTVLGRQTRITAFNMGTGASAQLNAYSSLSLDLTGRMNRFRQLGFGDFNNIGAQLSYSHQLSELTSVGVVGSISKSDYLGVRTGDARTYSVQGSLDRRFGERWKLSASAGMSSTRSHQLLGLPDVKFDAFTARLSFCYSGEFDRLCLNGSRSPEPSAAGEVRVNNTVQADYTRRLTARESITLTGSYARTGGSQGFTAALPPVSFVTGSVRYENQLREKISFFATANTSKINSSFASRNANYGVSAGLNFRFGALQ